MEHVSEARTILARVLGLDDAHDAQPFESRNVARVIPEPPIGDPLSRRVVPAWSVAECGDCRRFLRKGEYIVCRLCKKEGVRVVVCKRPGCIRGHAMLHGIGSRIIGKP